MTVRPLPPAMDGTGRRTVTPRAIEDMLLLGGWALPPDAPGTEAARDEARDVLCALGMETGGGDPGEVINRMKIAGLAGMLDFWLSHYVATGRRLLTEAIGAETPAALPSRRFVVEIRRSFALAGGGRARLRLPLPIAGPGLTDLRVEPLLPHVVAEQRIAPGRLDVLLPDAPDAVTISARLSFVAHPAAPPVGDPADPVWLAEAEGPVRVTPRVRALAEALADGCDATTALSRFHDHLLDHFTCGVIPYERIGAAAATDWVLDTRWYDCRLGAALLVALCRARGIPARMIGGYLLWRVPTEHYWAEVHLPDRGWTPCDLLDWDLSAGGTDPAWRDALLGAIDYRMPTQAFPHIFTGASGGPTAPAWHRLVRATAAGTETDIVSIPDGRLLYREEVRLLPVTM